VQPAKRRAWLLIACCVVCCALLGLAAPVDWSCGGAADDADVCLCPATCPCTDGDLSLASLESVRLPSVVDDRGLMPVTTDGTVDTALTLLAAVPGGLCLLI